VDGGVRTARVGTAPGVDLGDLSDRSRRPGDTPMSALDVVGLVLAIGLLAYLVLALLNPEKFE
jgi:K+-transporting ATPase KdpF subunit